MLLSSTNHRPAVRVLLAASDPCMRERGREWLQSDGFDCHTAATSDEVVTLLDAAAFDALLLDVASPTLGHKRLFEEIRETYPELVLMALAPVEQRRLAVQALERGAAAYLLTPLDADQLRIELRHTLDWRRRLHDRLTYEQQLELEAAERSRDVRRREEELALRIVSASEYRDNETGGHIRRIGLYSGVLAEALGWEPSQVDDIRIAATMHDVGKIGVPDTILLKPGKLTPEEFDVIKQHTEIGAGILDNSDIPLLKLAREIAWCHHERWDGRGYPRGLKGEQIPESARIVALADVYDALSHARVYKPAYTHEETLAIMRRDRGTHFDPRIFDHFLAVVPRFQQIREEFTDQSLRFRGRQSSVAVADPSVPLETRDGALSSPTRSSENSLLPQAAPEVAL